MIKRMNAATRLAAGTFVICLCMAVAAAQEVGKPAAEAALKAFAGYAAHQNVHVRRAALDELAATDHELVCMELLRHVKDPLPEIRSAAVQGLTRQHNGPGSDEILRRVWRGRDEAERLELLKVLKAVHPPKARTVLEELARSTHFNLRLAAIEALGTYPDDDGRTTGALLAALNDKEPLVRLAALDALPRTQHKECVDALVRMLKDSDWRVRASAVWGVRAMRPNAAIAPLIALLDVEQGRLVDDVVAALEDLTVAGHGGDIVAWKTWWKRVSDRFVVPTKAEIEALRKKEEANSASYAKRDTGYDRRPYHGIRTRSRNMLFVIDCSTSMAETVVLDERDIKNLDEFRKRYGTMRTKIDIAREELIQLVAELPAHAKFNIITFNATVDTWKKGLVPADEGSRNAAIRWLSRLTTASVVPVGTSGAGRTNTYEAMNAAFGLMTGGTAEKATFKTDADTMFLLTDGNPTTGAITEPKLLIEHVAEVNRKAKMVIHTIGFGASNRPLIEALARDSGGQYVSIGG
ncbi:MAG: VWA domain-containing protein [Planctomycetes bacterium]|nr:VWA domain-containing protein [Planctomycetota bacterium]